MASGAKIIEALKQAKEGDFARVTIEGQTWVRRDWQRIETAPKDGTFVLLHSPDSNNNPFIGQWHDDADYPDGGAWWGDNDSGFAIDADPSHWMPLPEPPNA